MMMTTVRVAARARRWTVRSVLAAGLSGWGTLGLSAQELPDSVVPLDSVVVTVIRGSDGLGRTPFAVSVQGQQALQSGNTGLSLEEALQGLPGVQVQNRYNYTVGERISIRGLGARAQFGVRGLKVLVDGIPATLADGQSTLDHLDIGSLGRVEILRGPASALYGNGGGGVLSFETAQPPDVSIRQEAKGVFGDDGLVRLQSTTSGTAGGAAYLFNLAHLSYDGFRTHPDDPSDFFGGADRLNANAQLRTELGGGSLRITGNFFDLDGENTGQLNRADPRGRRRDRPRGQREPGLSQGRPPGTAGFRVVRALGWSERPVLRMGPLPEHGQPHSASDHRPRAHRLRYPCSRLHADPRRVR